MNDKDSQRLYDDEDDDENEKHGVRESNYDGRISGLESEDFG